MKNDAIYRPRELKVVAEFDLTAICVDVCQQADDDENVRKQRSLPAQCPGRTGIY